MPILATVRDRVILTRGQPAGGGYTPPPGTGWIGLWDASVAASFTSSGGHIQTIVDQSGAGNDLTGGVSGAIYNATAFNSRPGMTFVASARLSKSSFPLGTGNTLTLFGLVSLSASATDYGRIVSYTAPGASHDYNNNGSFCIVEDASTSNVAFARNGGPPSVAFGYDTPRRVIITLKSDGTIVQYIDGIASAPYAGAAGNFVSAGDFLLGFSAHDSLGSGQFAGVIAHAGVATAYSDAAAVAALDTYLKNKWGL